MGDVRSSHSQQNLNAQTWLGGGGVERSHSHCGVVSGVPMTTVATRRGQRKKGGATVSRGKNVNWEWRGCKGTLAAIY